MTGLVRLLAGYYRIRVRGAAPELALYRLTQAHIPFWDIVRTDDFASDISIRRKDWDQVTAIVSRVQEGADLLGEHGLLCHFRGLKKRKLFVLSVLLCLGLAYLLPNFVWCLHVEGNVVVPEQQILRELQELGVGFGTWGPSIVPQDLKNQMLNQVPALEWLTVNQSGGLATVVVRERQPASAIVDRRQVTNLIASRDCIVTKMEVFSGQAVCKTGQSMRAGELLVSGYADWEHCIQATRSLGEIYGRTWRQQRAVIPADWDFQSDSGGTHTRYALLLGRKRINFFQNSGIWYPECDKMVMYRQLTLPGGYSFPLTLVVETARERTVTAGELKQREAEDTLKTGTAAAARSDMVAGEIVREDLKVRRGSGVYELTGVYECHEMVARTAPAILMESEDNK